MNINIPTNIVFKHLEQSKKFITVEQGGTRSGKTYNELIWLIRFALYDNKWQEYRIEKAPVINIVRKTLPALKASAYRDFLDIMQSNNLFNPKNLNKSDLIYTFENGARFEFYSLDEAQKIRGRKRDLLFINEANEITLEDFKQLAFRTKSKIIMDYNPSDENSFIYDKILTRDDSEFFITTYKNNPFLDSRIISEIERLKDEDENMWNIYGLGLVGKRTELIYTNVEYVDSFDNIEFEDEIFGLDFGYNNPTALIKIGLKDKEFYETEKLCQSLMTNGQLIGWMQNNLTEKEKECVFYADCAEPQRIKEIQDAGFYIKPADKSVKDGIDFCKRFKIYARNCDINNTKELRTYSWKKDKNGNILDDPVKFSDHLRDASRYAKYTHYKDIFGKDIKTNLDNFITSNEIFIDKDFGEW